MFSTSDSILFFGAISCLLYWYLTNNYQYWKKRNVKGDKPYPLIGTVGEELLFRHHPAKTIQKTYQAYQDERMVGRFRARRPVLMVRDPDLIKSVLVRDFYNFQDRGFQPDTDREPIHKHLFLATGNEWKLLRQKLTPTFTSGKIRNMFPLVTECGKRLQTYLKDCVAQGKTPEIKETMAKYTTEVIGSCVFGIEMNSFQEEETLFRRMGKRVIVPTIKETLSVAALFFVPFVYKLFKLRVTSLEVQEFFFNSVKSVMQSRDYKPSTRNDFIDILIELKIEGFAKNKTEDNANDLKMTDELLAAQAFVFFIAGFETSSGTMSSALYELAKCPEVQEKLVKEIKFVLTRYDGKVTYESLNEMTYLRMVIDETLRKYPSLGILERTCTSKCTITGTDFELDKDVMINIPVYALHHDPQYYPEPEKFIPERFTPEAVAERHPFVYLPFGEGPRICIGLRFGVLQTMVGLIAVLDKFKVSVNDKTVSEIRLNPRSFVMTCQDDIYLTLQHRSSYISKTGEQSESLLESA